MAYQIYLNLLGSNAKHSLKTDPKPPWPSLFSSLKLNVTSLKTSYLKINSRFEIAGHKLISPSSPVKTITNHRFVSPGYNLIIKHTLNELPISWPVVPEICSQRFVLETKIHLQRPIIAIVPTTAAATPRVIRITLDFLDSENLDKIISKFAMF